VATHHHLALIRVATETSEGLLVQNFFVFTAGGQDPSSSLKALPPCTTEPVQVYTRGGGRRAAGSSSSPPSWSWPSSS
jgi:hypothetical protein